MTLACTFTRTPGVIARRIAGETILVPLNQRAEDMALFTLRQMSLGGMNDQEGKRRHTDEGIGHAPQPHAAHARVAVGGDEDHVGPDPGGVLGDLARGGAERTALRRSSRDAPRTEVRERRLPTMHSERCRLPWSVFSNGVGAL